MAMPMRSPGGLEYFPLGATGLPGIAARPQRRQAALPLPIQLVGRTPSVELCNQGLERAPKPQVVIAASFPVCRGFDERRDFVVLQVRHDIVPSTRGTLQDFNCSYRTNESGHPI